MEKDLKGRSERSKTVHSNMVALERDDERLDPSTRVLTVLARISKTRLPNYRDDVYRLKREQEQKQDFFFRTSICNPFLR